MGLDTALLLLGAAGLWSSDVEPGVLTLVLSRWVPSLQDSLELPVPAPGSVPVSWSCSQHPLPPPSVGSEGLCGRRAGAPRQEPVPVAQPVLEADG